MSQDKCVFSNSIVRMSNKLTVIDNKNNNNDSSNNNNSNNNNNDNNDNNNDSNNDGDDNESNDSTKGANQMRLDHVISHHITSHHITSHHITSHHITSHHIISYQHTPAYSSTDFISNIELLSYYCQNNLLPIMRGQTLLKTYHPLPSLLVSRVLPCWFHALKG